MEGMLSLPFTMCESFIIMHNLNHTLRTVIAFMPPINSYDVFGYACPLALHGEINVEA